MTFSLICERYLSVRPCVCGDSQQRGVTPAKLLSHLHRHFLVYMFLYSSTHMGATISLYNVYYIAHTHTHTIYTLVHNVSVVSG